MPQKLYVFVRVIYTDTYIFIFDDKHRNDMLDAISKYAKNKDLNFGCYDAAVLSKEICETNALD